MLIPQHGIEKIVSSNAAKEMHGGQNTARRSVLLIFRIYAL